MLARIGRLVGGLALVASSVVLSVVLAEGVLRLVLNPSDFLHASLVEDPILGRRIEPLTTGHDSLGFRNSEVPSQASIVAIGDSNTYGVSAPREGSWPFQLGGLLGEPVYNMGLGGFGPLQYLHLAQVTAKALHPRVWVVGFYFGNDLMDAYYTAHGRTYWHSWRQSEGASHGGTEFDLAGSAAPTKRFARVRDWLSRNSLLYSVLRATVLPRMAAKERQQIVQRSLPDVQWAWTDPVKAEVHTVFTPQSRLAALNLDNPSVREGMQITQRAFSAIQAEADKQGVKLLLVLIPTKERAYCKQLALNAAAVPVSHAKLCVEEIAAQGELVRSLGERGTRFVDATPALEAQIAEHAQLYPTDADGHLQSAGYAVVAQVVAGAIRRESPKP